MDVNYRTNYEEQLAELELLQSMFPGDGELDLDDDLVQSVQSWLVDLDSDLHLLPSLLEFRLKLALDTEDALEMVVTLPAEYPSLTKPEVYVRDNRLDRKSQAEINNKLGEFIAGDEVIDGEPCLITLISWLQEHGGNFFTEVNNKPIVEKAKVSIQKFFRYWVYSHHIYSKVKRRDLQGLASEFNLTGFVMPGKPGVICVEGNSADVNDWWAIVRNWQWKMIKLKVQEDQDATTVTDIEEQRVFTGFQEIGVLKECQRGNHMDMGEFQKYLQEHDIHWVFKELFGIDRS